MRIAYISYEHPLGIAGGGIGTYIGQISRLMTNVGHEVEVFTCHTEPSDSFEYDGYLLHRVQANNMEQFRKNVADVFSNRHLINSFHCIEAAEYGADALFIKQKFLALPLVVKLHTPSYLTQTLNDNAPSLASKVRYFFGGLLRGKIVKPYWIYKKEDDPEYQQYCLADGLCSPSKSLAVLIKEGWPNEKPVAVIPNPFVPDNSFLNIPIAGYKGEEVVVSFFGRLEKRKGILDLMKAIPIILRHDPRIIFQFVGKAHPSPVNGMDMEDYLKEKLKPWSKHLLLAGSQPYNNIPDLLAKTHICVFPSLWENFPNVCLEAMAAGRAVIASNNGGMADMITDNVDGLLILPQSPESIASAVIRLLDNPSTIKKLGQAARQRVLDEYNEAKTGRLVTDFYRSVIGQTTSRTLQPKAI